MLGVGSRAGLQATERQKRVRPRLVFFGYIVAKIVIIARGTPRMVDMATAAEKAAPETPRPLDAGVFVGVGEFVGEVIVVVKEDNRVIDIEVIDGEGVADVVDTAASGTPH